MGIILMACNPCSGCNQVVANYLANLERDNTLCKLEDYTIAYGQNANIPAGFTGKFIRTCTRNLNDMAGVYIPGCPPHPQDISKKLDIDSPQL